MMFYVEEIQIVETKFVFVCFKWCFTMFECVLVSVKESDQNLNSKIQNSVELQGKEPNEWIKKGFVETKENGP